MQSAQSNEKILLLP